MTSKEKIQNDERGLSLLEISIATAGVLALSAGAVFVINGSIQQDQQVEALRNAVSTGYSEALDVMTGFEYEDENVAEGMTARLASVSQDEYSLTYAGTTPESLCVFVDDTEWDVDIVENEVYNGACGDTPDEVENIVTGQNTLTILHYRCDADKMVNTPLRGHWNEPYTEIEYNGNIEPMIEWDDGNSYMMVADRDYRIMIDAKYDIFDNHHDNTGCLREIEHMGKSIQVDTISNLGTGIISVPKDMPTSIENMRFMFNNAADFNDPNITHWDTRNVRNMQDMFSGASRFNQDISIWNTGRVEDFSGMFSRATSFDQPIGAWDTKRATSTSIMFNGASSFNQNLNNWDMSNVRHAYDMFQNATLFNNGGQSLEWESIL